MCRGKKAVKRAKEMPADNVDDGSGKVTNARDADGSQTDIVNSCNPRWLEAKIVDDRDVPLPAEECILHLDGVQQLKGVTDKDGVVRFDGLPVASEHRLQLINVLENWMDLVGPPEKHWIPKPDSYRSKDGTTHLVKTCVPSQKQKIVVDRLSEQEKFKHFRDAYEDNGAQYKAASPNIFASAPPRWEWGLGAVCNQHVNFFLGYWFNYNSSFTTQASRTYMAALTLLNSATQAVNTPGGTVNHRGYAEFVETLQSQEYTYKHPVGGTLEYMRVCAERFDRATGNPTGEFFNSLAEYNVYSVTDLKRNSVSTAETRVRKWLGAHPSKVPSGKISSTMTSDEIWDLVWDLKENDPDAGTLIRDLRSLLGNNVDHHAGVLIKHNGDLYTFSADSGAAITLRRFGSRDVVTRKFFHIAIWRLKSLRPGGYAPESEEKNAGGISIDNPSRFVWWKP